MFFLSYLLPSLFPLIISSSFFGIFSFFFFWFSFLFIYLVLRRFVWGFCDLFVSLILSCVFIWCFVVSLMFLFCFKKNLCVYVLGCLCGVVETLQQKVSMYAKWFHWILSEFISLVSGDYWIAPTFCNSEKKDKSKKKGWKETKRKSN